MKRASLRHPLILSPHSFLRTGDTSSSSSDTNLVINLTVTKKETVIQRTSFDVDIFVDKTNPITQTELTLIRLNFPVRIGKSPQYFMYEVNENGKRECAPGAELVTFSPHARRCTATI